MSADFSELIALQHDLGEVPKTTMRYVRKAVEVSARNVKDTAKGKVRTRPHFAKAAAAISYDIKGFSGFGASVIDAEIGYEKTGAGSLGNLIEFGAPRAISHFLARRGGQVIPVPVPGKPRRPLPPGMELQHALAETEDDFTEGIDQAIDDALTEAGL